MKLYDLFDREDADLAEAARHAYVDGGAGRGYVNCHGRCVIGQVCRTILDNGFVRGAVYPRVADMPWAYRARAIIVARYPLADPAEIDHAILVLIDKNDRGVLDSVAATRDALGLPPLPPEDHDAPARPCAAEGTPTLAGAHVPA